MIYVVGIDGGGTKTQGILCNSLGEILAVYTGGPSNHQYISLEEVKTNIAEVFQKLTTQAGICPEEVGFAFLGMAGADSEMDYQILSDLLLPVFDRTPFCVQNDIWSAAAAVPSVKWGAVAVCGTGYNMAFRDRTGKKYTLRALEYEHGNLSATEQLIKDALHYAFRSEEHTGCGTKLEKELPRLLGLSGMEEILSVMNKEPQKIFRNGDIVKAVFVLARNGDRVCQDILVRFGTAMGEMLGNFIKYIVDEEECVPVVISGSLFTKAESRLHIDAMILAMRREVSDFLIIPNNTIPAIGSCIEALNYFGIETDTKLWDTMNRSLLSQLT